MARPPFRFRMHPIVIANQRVKGKRCRDCQRFLYPTARWFHKDKNRPDGVQLYCTPCKRMRDRRSYEKNWDQRRKEFKQWRIEHRDEVNARHRVYIREYRQGPRRALDQPDPEQIRPLDVRMCPGCGGTFPTTEFRSRGSECRTCWSRRQSKYRNRAKRASYRQNRRARSAGVVTSGDWQAIFRRYENRCAYCGTTGKLTMDHVVPLVKGGAHDPSNIVPACARCNSRKHSKLWRPRSVDTPANQ